MIEVAIALAGGVFIGWFLSWHAKRTFRFEVTIVNDGEAQHLEEIVPKVPPKELDPPDIDDADWWKKK